MSVPTNTPSPATSSAPRAVGLRDWIGPAISAACLVHCVVMVALPPLLPMFFATQAENPLVEQVLWAAAIGAAGFIAWMRRRHLTHTISVLLAAALVVGLAGHLGAFEPLVHASFAALLVGQLLLVRRTRRECVDHC